MTDTTNLIAHLVEGIERARAARRAAFVLTPDAVLPVHIPHTPATTTPRLPYVARPQACDCGASQHTLVAHWERCSSRTQP